MVRKVNLLENLFLGEIRQVLEKMKFGRNNKDEIW